MTSRIEFKIMWSESVETMKILSDRISFENRTEEKRIKNKASCVYLRTYLAWLPHRDTSTLLTLDSDDSFFSFRTRAKGIEVECSVVQWSQNSGGKV